MSTETGSCACGNIKVTITGEPEKNVLCHCVDCHKTSGSHFSQNGLVLDKNFSLDAGTPKEFTKTSDSGRVITSHFCPDCGTTLWRSGDFFPGGKIVKTGIMDDPKWLENRQPDAELFPERKVAWLPNLLQTPSA
ncbi:hypothetical protein V497_07449 [Pseudogymnoascus sp. VKM F-4516 (FW-969)]|nr:hypothetical protein V490_08863 [Pseudogymnoascus sp. VKM F-3557]KFY54791.1 hypothetical protein V497_07449 [Pseudogymnoascus sp. VKM F-4516 (FW-969)]